MASKIRNTPIKAEFAMDSAYSAPTTDQIAQLVVEKLIRAGRLADLTGADLLTIEEETIRQVDEVTRAVLNDVLAKQSDQAKAPAVCPPCGGRLTQKMDQGRSLQCSRGRIHFKTHVFHCEACRLDFFPQMKTLQCDVDQEQTPAVLRKVSIAVARDRSYATASRNLEDPADLRFPRSSANALPFASARSGWTNSNNGSPTTVPRAFPTDNMARATMLRRMIGMAESR